MADHVRTIHRCSSAFIVEFSWNIFLVTVSLNEHKNTYIITVPRGITFSVFFFFLLDIFSSHLFISRLLQRGVRHEYLYLKNRWYNIRVSCESVPLDKVLIVLDTGSL